MFNKDHKFSQISVNKELEVLKQLDHPNLVTLIGIHESEHEIILLMDLYDSSLDRVLHNRKSEVAKGTMGWFSEKDMIQWCIQLLDGLAYLHSKHIAHRDLKVKFFLCLINHPS